MRKLETASRPAPYSDRAGQRQAWNKIHWSLSAAMLFYLMLNIALRPAPVHSQGTVNIAMAQGLAVLKPAHDTYISSLSPNTSFGASTELRLQQQRLTHVAAEHVLAQFDLGPIPADASIQHAELRLFQRSSSGSIPIALDRVTAPWDENTVTWNNPPDTAFFYAQMFAPQTVNEYISWDVTDLANGWHEQPQTTPNYGLMLRFGQGQELSALRAFDSKEGDNPPQLRVLYTPAQVEIPGGALSDPLDPDCVANNIRYKDGAHFSFRDASGFPTGQAYFIHDGAFLYVCVTGAGDTDRFFGVYIDTDRAQNEPPGIPTAGQISLRIDIQSGQLSSWRGTGDPARPYAPDRSIQGWDAVSNQPQVSFDTQVAEYRIPLALLGNNAQCGAPAGLAVYQQSNQKPDDDYGWPRREGPNTPSSWATVILQDIVCPIQVICTETNLPCAPTTVQVFDADSGAAYTVGRAGYVVERADIHDGDRLWARVMITPSGELPYAVYHTSGAPQTVGLEEFAADPAGVMTLRVGPNNPLMTYDIAVSGQWRLEDDPAYTAWLLENLYATSAYLYRYSHEQIALGAVTVRQDGAGWQDADIRLHAHNHMRPNAILGGVNTTPIPDPDNDQLPSEIEGEIFYWPGITRIGSAWNRFNVPEPPEGFAVDVSQDWAIVLGHELGHYLLYLRDTYFRIGPNDTIVNVYSCTGSAMGWVYFPENHGFVADPQHWEENCRDTYGNNLLNRSEWATLSRFFPWLQPPAGSAPMSIAALPAGITTIDLAPADGESPGAPNQPVDLLYKDDEAASTAARAFLFRDDRIIDQGAPVPGSTHVNLVGSQIGDRLCLIDINVTTDEQDLPRHQFGCDALVPGDNALPLRKDTAWAPVILLTPVTTLTMDIEIIQPLDSPLVARLYPEDITGWVEAPLVTLPDPGGQVTGTFQFSPPIMSGFVHVYVDESEEPGLPRREAIIDYGANGGGLPGPTSSFGHAPVISSSDGKAVFLLTEGVELAAGEFIAWQSMIGRPPISSTVELVSQSYRLIALPPELVDAGVVSIRYPALAQATIQAAGPDGAIQAGEDAVLHFWNGANWIALETELVTDPNDEIIASASSQGVGVYALLTQVETTPPALFIPMTMR